MYFRRLAKFAYKQSHKCLRANVEKKLTAGSKRSKSSGAEGAVGF
jgi:hypothetical protein